MCILPLFVMAGGRPGFPPPVRYCYLTLRPAPFNISSCRRLASRTSAGSRSGGSRRGPGAAGRVLPVAWRHEAVRPALPNAPLGLPACTVSCAALGRLALPNGPIRTARLAFWQHLLMHTFALSGATCSRSVACRCTRQGGIFPAKGPRRAEKRSISRVFTDFFNISSPADEGLPYFPCLCKSRGNEGQSQQREKETAPSRTAPN